MRFKRIFQIGVWAFCLLVAFSVHGSVRDKGYILVINSYTEGAIWSNYVIAVSYTHLTLPTTSRV